MVEPLAEATTIDEIDRYPWPDMDDPTRVAHMTAEAASWRRTASTRSWRAVAAVPARAGVRDPGDGSVPDERRALPGLRDALLRRIPGCASGCMGHVLDAVGDSIDIIKIGDDLGTQQSLLMSPAMYRRMLKPIHADLSPRSADGRTQRSSSTPTATSSRCSTTSSRSASTSSTRSRLQRGRWRISRR